jgi:outer membrane usher protein
MARRDRRRAFAPPLIAVLIALLGAAPKTGAAATTDQNLLLAVVINNYPIGKIGDFVLRDGALYARREELRGLGFQVPEPVVETKEGLVGLSSLPHCTSRLDQATQTLYVSVGTETLLPTELEAGTLRTGGHAVESGIGTTLNYDVTGTSTGNGQFGNGSSLGRQVGSGQFDLRGFSPWGVVSSGLLAYAGGNPVNSGGYPAIRLDSTYVYSDPETMRRYRVGDFISGFLSWTRPVRLGGAQINSDFSMRPDLITFPVPVVSGSVAIPSTVDVLVNGMQVLSRQVQPGPFQVPQLPIITGAGTVSMAMTNALGQQTTTELPFYASPSLLAPDLQTYSGEAGLVRRNWGVVSNDYGSPAGEITYRRGLSSILTVEGHGEASRGLFMAGAGGVMNLGDLAVANLAVAGSSNSGQAGGQLAAGLQRTGPQFSLAGSAILATRTFADIAALNGDPPARLQLTASGALPLGRFGSLGIAYIGIERSARPPPVQVIAPPGIIVAQGPSLPGPIFFQPTQRSQIVAASYSVQLFDVSLYATAFSDFANRGGNGVMLGLTLPLWDRASATASASSEAGIRTGQIQVQQDATTIGDWGYRVLGAVDHPDHEFAEVSYKSPWALVIAGADRYGSQTTMQAEARGALSFTGGGLFASNRIDDSFAVVDTNGVEGIRVRQENRDVGRTDSSGLFLVPDLRSFEINHVSIDPTDAPMDATVPFASREVRPQDRSGVIVRFPLTISHGALLRLTDESGKPLPVGSTATLHSTGIVVPVGYGGEAYLVDLQPHNQVDVEKPDGRRCTVSFGYRHTPGDIPTLGPLPCQDARP